ncbi:MAG: hypothetical protein IH616_10960 [Gemmatimonadales bacterium]|nr:hypothetical protein [Gemmatimonadales bacterium]
MFLGLKDSSGSQERDKPRSPTAAAPTIMSFVGVRVEGVRGICGYAEHCSKQVRTLAAGPARSGRLEV